MSSVPANPSGPASAQIADLTYRTYEGPLKNHAARWWTVALSTIRANVRKPAFWILVGLIVLIYVVNAIIFYFTKSITNQLQQAQVGAAAALALDLEGRNSVYAKTLFQCATFSGILLFLLALIVGSGSIAADNRANALLVYLSKPITKADYLLGKWAGVFLMLAAVSLVPPLLLYLFFLTAYYDDGFLKGNGWLILRLLGASLIAPVIHASLVIGFSAWSRSSRLAGAIYAGAYFALGVLMTVTGGIMFRNAMLAEDRGDAKPGEITRAVTVMSLSVKGVSDGLSAALYDVDPAVGPPRFRERIKPPATVPLLLLGGVLIALPLAAAQSRIRAVEVVKG